MQELITYGADRRLVLSNGEAIRELVYGATWSSIRIGIQMSLIGMAANLVTPVLAVGVCSGPNGYGIPSTTNVTGVKMSGTNNLTYDAGPPAFALSNSTYCAAFKRVGSTLTSSANSLTVSRLGIDDMRTGFIVQIEKGSPNYTFRLCGHSGTGTSPTDLTDTEFEQLMDIADLSNASTVKTNYAAGSVTLAVDEVAGAFDHLFVYWSRTSVKMSFNIKHRMIS